MNKLFILLSVLFGLTSCNSNNEENNSIENQMIGTWLSSECGQFVDLSGKGPIKVAYTFTTDTVTEIRNYHNDSTCSEQVDEFSLLLPLNKLEELLADTGEQVLHLEWVRENTNGDVIVTSLTVYVEGENLYMGNVVNVDGVTTSTIDFSHPYMKQVD